MPNNSMTKMNITKKDLVDQIYNLPEMHDVLRKDISLTVYHFIDLVARALDEGHSVELRGLGSFKPYEQTRKVNIGISTPTPRFEPRTFKRVKFKFSKVRKP